MGIYPRSNLKPRPETRGDARCRLETRPSQTAAADSDSSRPKKRKKKTIMAEPSVRSRFTPAQYYAFLTPSGPFVLYRSPPINKEPRVYLVRALSRAYTRTRVNDRLWALLWMTRAGSSSRSIHPCHSSSSDSPCLNSTLSC